MKRKIVNILLGVIALVAVVSIIYMLKKPTEIPLTKVTLKTAELTFTEQGNFVSGQVIQIYPLSEGKVLNVAVKEGEYVNAGDVICTIDPETIQERINQINSTIAGYQAQLQTWQSQNQNQNQTVSKRRELQNLLIKQSEKSLELAKKELNRISILYENDFVSLVDLEQAQSFVEQQELMLQSQQQELELIFNADRDSQMESYYQSLIDIEKTNLKLLEKELLHTTVIAVSSGTITALPVQETNYVSGMSPVAELTVTDKLFVETYVSTNDISSIALGDPVVLTLNRRDGDITFEGAISYIGDKATLMISPLGLEERKVKIKVTPNLSLIEENIGIGYDVDVQFLLYKENEQLTVPKTALFKDNEVDKVWLVKNGVLHAAEVITGTELRTETVVLSGLEANSFVVTDANDEALKEGLRVINSHKF